MIMHPLGRVAALLFFMATIPALLLQGHQLVALVTNYL